MLTVSGAQLCPSPHETGAAFPCHHALAATPCRSLRPSNCDPGRAMPFGRDVRRFLRAGPGADFTVMPVPGRA